MRQIATSEALGCKCGGTTPLAAMSTRAMVRPNVLTPGRLSVSVRVALNPKGLAFGLPGLDRTDVVKWDEFASFGLMQGAPLR